jgi:hypothetical protein
MSFGKPFRAKPVKLGPYWKGQQQQTKQRRSGKLAVMAGLAALGVFAAGMLATNWPRAKTALPTYYPSCAWARSAGKAPIHRGQPGYRRGLDADSDGIACEPYAGRD